MYIFRILYVVHAHVTQEAAFTSNMRSSHLAAVSKFEYECK